MLKTLSCIAFVVLLGPGAVLAQEKNSGGSLSQFGPHDIRLSVGILTTEQWNGIETSHETGFDFPKAISGADFISYRYSLINWLAAGITLGLDYQNGSMTNYSKSSDNRKTGSYSRNSYTIATEYIFTYMDKRSFQMYSGFGVGYTFYRATGTYDKEYYNIMYYNGVNKLQRDRTVQYRQGHINAQFTGFGIKSNGQCSFFTEVGWGYKGLLNIGLSYRLK